MRHRMFFEVAGRIFGIIVSVKEKKEASGLAQIIYLRLD